MPDRLVVYKSPFQRFIETVLVVIPSFAAAEAWKSVFPDISPSYAVVAALVLGFAIVPRIGGRMAVQRGGALMTRDERTRRYLSELGPMAPQPRFRGYPAIRRPYRRG